jgi:hypothetical protein
LPDGRNTHLIQQPKAWWDAQLAQYFTIGKAFERGAEIHYVVGPLKSGQSKIAAASGPRVALGFDGLTFRREPYVIGAAQNVLEPALYTALAESFPPLELFKAFGGGRKWSLSTVNHPDQYAGFLKSNPLWQAFARYIKDPAFIEQIRMVLKAHGLTPLDGHDKLKARFEFSAMSADGGCIRPHTDITSKLVTLVVSMLPPVEDWDPAWGGGTDVLVPKNTETPPDDYKAGFEAFDVVGTYPYQPNQCVLFIKSPASWHAVAPMVGPGAALRRTLTINVERA